MDIYRVVINKTDKGTRIHYYENVNGQVNTIPTDGVGEKMLDILKNNVGKNKNATLTLTARCE